MQCDRTIPENKTSVELSIQWKNCILGTIKVTNDVNNWEISTRCENRTSIILYLTNPTFEVISSDTMILFVSYNNSNPMRLHVNASESTVIYPTKYPTEKLSFYSLNNICNQVDSETEHLWLTESSCIDVENPEILDLHSMQLLKTIFMEKMSLNRYKTIIIENLSYLESVYIMKNPIHFYSEDELSATTTIYISNCTNVKWIEIHNIYYFKNMIISGIHVIIQIRL